MLVTVGGKLLFIFVVCSFVVCSLLGWERAAATQPFGDKRVDVEGGADCGEWLSSRQNGSAIGFEDFALGMLDGLAMGSDREYWRADGRAISWDAAYFSIDQYCRRHPTDLLIIAIANVFQRRAEGKNAAGR
jgi:hypothetical protein